MKVTAKKCKGTGKAIGSGCGSMQLVRKYGLGVKCGCYSKWLLNTPEGKETIDSHVIRAHKKETTNLKKLSREQKEQNKSIAKLIQEARKPFQQWIRMRDANESCISCGSTTSEIWDAGHFLKAELYSGLIFMEENCNKQCRKCNTYLNGNEGEYRIGMIKKYGADAVEHLDNIKNELRTFKYTREELNDIKHKYLKLLKL